MSVCNTFGYYGMRGLASRTSRPENLTRRMSCLRPIWIPSKDENRPLAEGLFFLAMLESGGGGFDPFQCNTFFRCRTSQGPAPLHPWLNVSTMLSYSAPPATDLRPGLEGKLIVLKNFEVLGAASEYELMNLKWLIGLRACFGHKVSLFNPWALLCFPTPKPITLWSALTLVFPTGGVWSESAGRGWAVGNCLEEGLVKTRALIEKKGEETRHAMLGEYISNLIQRS